MNYPEYAADEIYDWEEKLDDKMRDEIGGLVPETCVAEDMRELFSYMEAWYRSFILTGWNYKNSTDVFFDALEDSETDEEGDDDWQMGNIF